MKGVFTFSNFVALAFKFLMRPKSRRRDDKMNKLMNIGSCILTS